VGSAVGTWGEVVGGRRLLRQFTFGWHLIFLIFVSIPL
jgi:hypothetical protein